MSLTLQELGQWIANRAPLLGGALAGSAGATVGSLIAATFGGTTREPQALQALIQADPQAAMKLKALELEHEIALQQLSMQSQKEEQALLLSDRANARNREAQVDQALSERRDSTPANLAYALMACMFAALAWLFCCPTPPSNHELIVTFVSSLTTAWVGAMGYYHGSSTGSRSRDRHWSSYWQGHREARGVETK